MPMSDVSTWLRSASSRSRASASASVSPAGRSSGMRSRMASGTARSTSSATEATSSAASMLSISAAATARCDGPRTPGSCPSRATGGRTASFVTTAGTARPRTSTTSSSPSAASGGRNASAIPCPRVGEKLPLVTTPTAVAVARHRVALTRDLAALDAEAPEPPRHARARARPRAAPGRGSRPCRSARPRPDPACSGVMPGPSSWPWSGRPASSRSVSRAPRPAGVIPASSRRCQQRAAADTGTWSSTPSSPVYPVPATQPGSPSKSVAATVNARHRGGLGRDRREPGARLGPLHREHGARTR